MSVSCLGLTTGRCWVVSSPEGGLGFQPSCLGIAGLGQVTSSEPTASSTRGICTDRMRIIHFTTAVRITRERLCWVPDTRKQSTKHRIPPPSLGNYFTAFSEGPFTWLAAMESPKEKHSGSKRTSSDLYSFPWLLLIECLSRAR